MDLANSKKSPLERLLEILRAEGLDDTELLRDALWLAQFLPAGEAREPERPKDDRRRPPIENGGADAKNQGRSGDTESPPPPAPTPNTSDSPAGGELHPIAGKGSGPGKKATPIYVPASGALPQPLELTRALRPFQQKFRSRRQVSLDVNATAELSADRREITPVLVREKERWFSISLLVDDAPSMAVWRKTASQLARFLGTLGIFRDVRTWSVSEDLRLTSGSGRLASSKQLVDPSGRTLIVVLTNGVGRHWQSREMAEWLAGWARVGPVAICSLLPPVRWAHTDLGPAYLWARASVPGAGNRLLTAGEGPRTVVLKDSATVFPVYPLTRQGLEDWAAMQMSRRETKVAALAIAPAWFDTLNNIAAEPESERDAKQRVAEFRSVASREAAQLLEFLTAVPLSLPVMRMVQHTMMPESPLSAMAEVLMSGLIVPSKIAAPGADAESMLFDFTPDARKYLRDRTSVRDLEQIHKKVLGAVEEYIARRAGKSEFDFEAWADDPSGMKELPPDVEYFARVTAETLRALGYRKRRESPKPPEERPGVYVAWNEPEVEGFAQEVAAWLQERGLRVLKQGRDDLPLKGSILMVLQNPDFLDSDHVILTDQLVRLLESGLEGTMLAGPGVAPGGKPSLFADAYATREEMLEATLAEIGKRDVNPAPRPTNAPPLDRERGLLVNPDSAEVERLMSTGTVVLFSNKVFTPVDYVRDLVWARDTRLQFSGGIHWLRAGDRPEERPGQLLIFEEPDGPVRIPADCTAVLLDPETKALFDLPETTVSYEGSPETKESIAADAALLLSGTLPPSVLQDIRHSPRLLDVARRMAGQEKVWSAIRNRFAEEWQRSHPNTLIGLEIHIVRTVFESLDPAMRDGAGILAALRGRTDQDLIDSLVPLERRKTLADWGLVVGPDYEIEVVGRKLAPMSPHWGEWNAKVLDAAGLIAGDWLGSVTRNAYARRNLIYHLIQTGNMALIETVVTSFEWWALRIEIDGTEKLLDDLRSLPNTQESFLQIQAFLNSLPNAAELTRDQYAAAIWRYDLPLPQTLRAGARSALNSSQTPSQFLLLAGSWLSDSQFDEAAAWAAEAIARETARRELGLVCGGENGSDSVAIRAFIKERSAMGIHAGPALRVVTSEQHPIPFAVPPGTKVVRSDEQVTESVRLADVVVVLGGDRWIPQMARAALLAEKPIFAVPGAGGAAAALFQEHVKTGRRKSDAAWTRPLRTKEDAAQMAKALLDDILGAPEPAARLDSRLEVLSACRSAVLPPFVVKALGTSPLDEILARDGRIALTADGGIAVEENVHKTYHRGSNPELHRAISAAIETNPQDVFSLRERLFHLILAGEREKAISVATDVRWLIPATEVSTPDMLEDLLSLGLTDLVADLRASTKPIRARLAASKNLEIARAAIRYEQASIFVEVGGSGSHVIGGALQQAAEAMGGALARVGFGLITGAWPGVDYVTAEAYLKSGGKSLVHAVTPSSIERFKEALEVNVEDESTAEKLADGVVLIGGLGGTMRIFYSARALGKPVFPYGPSGGDARDAVQSLGPSAGPLASELSPEEFASFVTYRLGTGEKSASLERIWELAAQYDEIRGTMGSGLTRTTAMTALFSKMLQDAPGGADHLAEFQLSASAGRRLAAIAILQKDPRRDALTWLAERLDNPSVEKPFVGFQAAVALRAAVSALELADCDALEQNLDRARGLGEKLTTDPGRLRVLAEAELVLMRKRCSRDEELDVTRLVRQTLLERGFTNAVLTRNLLIFRTKGQRTWITFTTAAVLCSLDNRPKGKDYFRTQWVQQLRDIEPGRVKAEDRPGKSGLFAIGSSKNWLYSPELFNSTRLKEIVLKELARAKEFRDRLAQYDLL